MNTHFIHPKDKTADGFSGQKTVYPAG